MAVPVPVPVAPPVGVPVGVCSVLRVVRVADRGVTLLCRKPVIGTDTPERMPGLRGLFGGDGDRPAAVLLGVVALGPSDRWEEGEKCGASLGVCGELFVPALVDTADKPVRECRRPVAVSFRSDVIVGQPVRPCGRYSMLLCPV